MENPKTWQEVYDLIMAEKQVNVDILYHDEIYGVRPRLQKFQYGDWIDLYTAEDCLLHLGEHKIISLGISMKLPRGYEAIIAPRSSTFKKFGVIMSNSIGIIDNTFCGEYDIWGCPVWGTRNVEIPKDTKICQFRLLRNQPNITLNEVEYLSSENRGGFGSTDTL